MSASDNQPSKSVSRATDTSLNQLYAWAQSGNLIGAMGRDLAYAMTCVIDELRQRRAAETCNWPNGNCCLLAGRDVPETPRRPPGDLSGVPGAD